MEFTKQKIILLQGSIYAIKLFKLAFQLNIRYKDNKVKKLQKWFRNDYRDKQTYIILYMKIRQKNNTSLPILNPYTKKLGELQKIISGYTDNK